MWSRIKPRVDYFRVFGSLAHVHVPDTKRSKLDDKSMQCVLLGVSDESKAYRLFNRVSKKIIVSRDLSFEEDKGWNWGRTVEEVKHDILIYEGSNDSENSTFENEEEEVVEDTETPVDIVQEVETMTSTSSDSSNEDPPVHAEGRIRKAPNYLQDYESGEGLSADENYFAMFTSHEDPNSFEEAEIDEKWRKAMDLEMEAIEKNKTWQLTTLLEGAKKIGLKWVFRTKLNENGEVDKFKVRLVAKGYAQQQGINYNEVFAPVARWDTIRMVLALASQKGWSVYQLDVRSAFLHSELIEDVYAEHPYGVCLKG